MPETLTMMREQVAEIGQTIAKGLRDDLSKHVTDLLPDALKHHGIDPAALKGQRSRVPMSEDALLAGANYLPWDVDVRKNLLHRANAPGGEWKGFGEYVKALARVGNPHVGRGAPADARLKAALNETDPGGGGFLVPDQFIAQLMMIALEMAIIRPRAFNLPMSGPYVKIPAIRDTSHASTLFGGVQAYWTAEAATLTESEPVFRQIALIAKKLTGYTAVSNEMLADSSISLEPLLQRMFGEALAFWEDLAFIEGTGVGQPQGLLTAPCVVSVPKETGQAATTIVAENLDKMYSRMLPSSLSRAVWIAHNDIFPQLASLSRSVGAGGNTVWMSNIAGAPPATIYGRPVIFTEKCKTLGTTGDIYFADLSYYIIGQRQNMEMAASPHVLFTSDQTAYRFIERLDGMPWLDSAITPRNGSNTLSPIVKLDTRA